MAVNIKNKNCQLCKFSGIYLCTNSNKCENNSLYVKR